MKKIRRVTEAEVVAEFLRNEFYQEEFHRDRRHFESLVLDAAEGTVVLAGQAVQSRAEWEGATDSAASGAPEAADPRYPSSVERLRALDPVRVHFAHDAAIWERRARA